MKLEMEIGREETIEITVTEDMFAAFEGKVVHPVYSTVAMTYHMEWVSRKIILPFLEMDEEGMGASVQVKHFGPSPLGSKIIMTATLVEVNENVVVTNVTAYNGSRLIGKGKVKQVILPTSIIAEKLTDALALNNKNDML